MIIWMSATVIVAKKLTIVKLKYSDASVVFVFEIRINEIISMNKRHVPAVTILNTLVHLLLAKVQPATATVGICSSMYSRVT